MAQPVNMTALFRDIFEHPSLERMLKELDAYQFEDFVGYVFEQAGYLVEDVAGQRGPGLDLKLYIGPPEMQRLHAGVQVKQFPPDHLVTAPDVVRLRGSVAADSVFGHFVTTSGYVGPALVQANNSPRIWPIDGDHFVRYITYVRGTRSAAVKDQEPDSRLHTNPLAPIPPEVLFAADELQRRPPQQAKILTVANHKGGAIRRS